tara:strand:+ start:26 stop:802 length:777 start_codon:yes stop_codon:yes gene_type:complete
MALTKVRGKGISNLDELGVGTSSPTDTGGFGIAVDVSSSSGGAVYVRDAGGSKVGHFGQFNEQTSIVSRQNDGNIAFYVGASPSEAMRIDSNGHLILKKNLALDMTTSDGIDFGAAGSSANTLDDYEEGNWTPTLTSTSGVTKTAATGNLGRYTKVGNIVNATGTVQWNGTETLSGLVAVGGLPFTSVNTNGYRSAAAMGAATQVNQPSSYQNGLAMSMDQNTNLIWVVARSTSSFTHYPVIGNTGAIYGVNITYRTA